MTTAPQLAPAPVRADTTTISLDTLDPIEVFARLLAALRRLGPPTQAPLGLRVRMARAAGDLPDKGNGVAIAVRCAVRAWCGINVPVLSDVLGLWASGVDVTLVPLAGPSLRRAP